MAGSSSRGGARVLWVTVHTAEGIRKASDLQAFFNRSTDSSAHAVADDNTLLDNLVPYDRAAWTLRNGNPKSDNLELCGFASWSRDEWLTEHQGMLRNAANWIRSRCTARGIPITKLSAADVHAGKAGVIGHVDYTNGTGDGTHWDPGPGFPWDVVISMASGAVAGGGGSAGGGTVPSTTTTREESMAEFTKTSGKPRNITVGVPDWARGTKKGLVVEQGWVSSYWNVLKFIGPSPAAGSNIVKVVFARNATSGPFQVAPARPWEIDVPAGAVAVEAEYTMDDHPDVEVTGSLTFVGGDAL
ncbi:N-acetylmuramoyl-L-alanine amidase [Amycolatopsis sp. NPDC004368]